MHVAVVIPLIGLDDGIVERFADNLRASEPEACYEIVPVVRPATKLPNIAEAKNAGIRRSSWADVVVCADADLSVPPGLLDWSCRVAMAGQCAWQWPTDIGGSEPPVRRVCGKGAWNAMTYDNWVRVGGWDERCIGWGGEDDILHRDVALAGIEIVAGTGVLIHERHAPRSTRRSQDNLAVAQTTLWNWLVPNAHMSIDITHRCNLSCAHCSHGPIMKADPDYALSVGQVQRWIDATISSGYRFKSVVLDGGEPTLNPNLAEICRRIVEAGLCDGVKIFTNGVAPVDAGAWPYIDNLVISRHAQTARRTLAAVPPEYESVVVRIGRTRHYPWPAGPVPNSIPARCACGYAFRLYGDVVYQCPQAPDLAITVPCQMPYARVEGRYLDWLMNINPFVDPACALCNSNVHVREHVGLAGEEGSCG